MKREEEKESLFLSLIMSHLNVLEACQQRHKALALTSQTKFSDNILFVNRLIDKSGEKGKSYRKRPCRTCRGPADPPACRLSSRKSPANRDATARLCACRDAATVDLNVWTSTDREAAQTCICE